MATYTATKAFVLSFSEAIGADLAETGVRVLCVCPGFTRTEFQSRADVDTSQVPGMAWMTPEQVADEAVRAARKKKMRVAAMTGAAGASLARRCDACLAVPSRDTPSIQEMHLVVGHLCCERAEAAATRKKRRGRA